MRFRQQASTFSLDGVVDDPDGQEDGELDLARMEELFNGYEIVDHAHIKLTPVLLEEAPPAPATDEASAGGQPSVARVEA